MDNLKIKASNFYSVKTCSKGILVVKKVVLEDKRGDGVNSPGQGQREEVGEH